jgi:transposase
MPWRDLPERFGDWKQVHTRHTRCAKSGIWEKVFKTLAADADNEYAMIDSTIVRAHQHSAGAPKKTPRTTKRSGAVEED